MKNNLIFKLIVYNFYIFLNKSYFKSIIIHNIGNVLIIYAFLYNYLYNYSLININAVEYSTLR
jgi:hypothetical protein